MGAMTVKQVMHARASITKVNRRVELISAGWWRSGSRSKTPARGGAGGLACRACAGGT
jgi:hypothetical protein